MKGSKFTEAQKAFILRQGEEGTPVAEICRKAGISQATYFNWKKRYGGLLPDEMRRLKALEDENGRLKKISGRSDFGPRDVAGCYPPKALRSRCPAAVCPQTARGGQAALGRRIKEICETRVRCNVLIKTIITAAQPASHRNHGSKTLANGGPKLGSRAQSQRLREKLEETWRAGRHRVSRTNNSGY